MESGWEVNIARLIDKANETLAASAQSRPHDYIATNRRGWSGRNNGGASSSSSMGLSFTSNNAPRTLQGDRSASYRYGSGGWDGSSPGNRSQVPLPHPDGVSSNLPLAPRPASFSRPVEERVNDAKIAGMEDRIKLEVQAVVRRDVDQRASLAERASDALRKRVDGLTEEVSRLGDNVLELKTGSHSQKETLEQVLVDSEYVRGALGALEKWREERKDWFTQVDNSLSSLVEDARNLAHRTHTQQRILDEDMATREDLAAAVKRAREATETATASALAPVRKHFLEEIGTVRRRLLVEKEAQKPVVPPLTRAQVHSIARETASAEGEELWRKVGMRMRDNISSQARDTGIIGDDFILAFQGVENRLAKVEQRAENSHFLPETREATGASTAEVSGLRDTVSALQQRLDEALMGMAETCQERIRRESYQTAESEESKCSSEGLVAALDLDARIKRLEELEREHKPPFLDSLTPAATASSAWTDNKMEEMDKRVRELISGAAVTVKRQVSAEGRLEELGEELSGHSLKLRCLEGLWREPGCPGHDKLVAESSECGSSGNATDREGGDYSREGISSASNRYQNPRQQKQQGQQQHHAVSADGGKQVSASRKNIGSGFTSFLRRLGTSNASAASSREHGEVKAGVNHRVAGPAQAQVSTAARTGDTETMIQSRSPLKHDNDVDGNASAFSRVDETAKSAEWVEDSTGAFDGGRKRSEEIDVYHEALGQDLVDSNINTKTNTVDASQFGAIGSRDLDAANKCKSTPNGNQPYDVDGDAVHTPLDYGGGRLSRPDDSARDTRKNQRTRLVGNDPTQAASEAGALGVGKREERGEESKQPHQGDDCEAVTNSEVPVDSLPSTAPPDSTIKVPVASDGDHSRDAHDGGLENSGSVEGSVHSRWSLPDTELRDPRRLLEQRAIWTATGDEEGSVENLDQVLSSECGESRSDGRSSRSRVESYDLPRDVGEGYILPFSSGVGSAESELPVSFPLEADTKIEALSSSAGTSTRKTPLDLEALGCDVESGRALSPNRSARVVLTKASAAPVRVGGASSPASVKEFACSEGEDDSPTDRRSIAPLPENTETKTCREKGGDAQDDGKEEPVRGFCLDSVDYFDEIGGDSGPHVEKTPERRLKGDMAILDRSPGPRNRDGGEGRGSGALLDCSDPDPGIWTAPDFDFSSEEDEDRLDLDLSLSELSSSRVAEGTGENVTPPRPPSSPPTPGSIHGFDSSSSAAS